MIRELQLRILPEQAASEQSIAAYVAREQSMDIRSIKSVRVLKRSIDARQRTVMVNLKVRVYIDEFPQDDEFPRIEYGDVSGKPRAIVVGAGPAGLFAALRLIELGICPVVVERGKNVHDRRKDIALISREQRVDPESNYSFGEGGAGAFSDGKLYTRSKKRGSVERILQIFCQHGASVSILSDAHPHIGTDKLPRVIERMRNRIIESGGAVHFETRMERLIIDGDEVCGIVTADGREFTGPVILATGHSARDVYYMLHENGVELESKGIAIGVRLEHPQQLIDSIQYHNPEGRGKYLPAAEYSFVTQVKGRGVYSFCMCPGGFIVPAMTDAAQSVVNGMSPSGRTSPYANSGLVTEVRPADFEHLRAEWGELAGLKFQQQFEELARRHGGDRQIAPAQRVADFVAGRASASLARTSYIPGIVPSRLDRWMPGFIAQGLRQGLATFGRRMRGFVTNEAVVVGVESRTSSPVRIPRDPATLMHPEAAGLFPAGEGAGYAGGIISAALDGERIAEAVKNYID